VKQELTQLKMGREDIYKELAGLKEKREELKKRREEIKAEVLQLALRRKELRERGGRWRRNSRSTTCC